MFGAVICNEDNCRQLLELVLGIPIEHVEVSKEKSIVYHPEYKGVRLDIYAKDKRSAEIYSRYQAESKNGGTVYADRITDAGRAQRRTY